MNKPRKSAEEEARILRMAFEHPPDLDGEDFQGEVRRFELLILEAVHQGMKSHDVLMEEFLCDGSHGKTFQKLFFAALHELLDAGLLKRIGGEPAEEHSGAGAGRCAYELTPLGKGAVEP